MKKLLGLLLCLGLCGCATTAKYDAKLNQWIGATEDSLVASWGIPNKTYNLNDGKKAVEFVRKETIQTGGYTYTIPQRSYQSGVIGDKAYSGTATNYETVIMPIQQYKLTCKTTFILNASGQVESWHHDGNDCVSE